jgi:hypothetical protein
MKRRVRERVIGVWAEDAGEEEAEEVGREFMVVCHLPALLVRKAAYNRLPWP